MSTIISLLTIATWVFAVWFMLVRIEDGYCKKDLILKSCASACIVLVGIVANIQWILTIRPEPLHGEISFHYLIGIALIFGLLGDVRLGQSHIIKDKKVQYRKEGIICFAIDHILNIIAMMLAYDMTYIKYVIIAFALAVAMGVIVGFGGRKFGFHFGRYTAMVSVYVGLLALDVFLAWALYHSTNVAFDAATLEYETTIASEAYQAAVAADPAAVIAAPVMTPFMGAFKAIAAGQLAFIISDATLAPMYFGKVGNKPHFVIVNHFTYYLAQLLMAVSLITF